MADLSHIYGEDLSLSPVGGLLVMADGTQLTQQRVIRRILTWVQAYLYSPDYGMGAGQYVGTPADDDRIKARILKNMRLEPGVDQTQPVTVTVLTDPGSGTTAASIKYTDRVTGQTSLLTLPIER